MKKVWIGFVLAAAPLAVSFAGSIAPPARGGQLTLAVQADAKTLDPLQAIDEVTHLVRYLTGGVLIRFNRQTQRLEPELAVSWKFSEGGRAIAFRLRPGVVFPDGTPFRSKDVCYTIQRLMDPAVASPFADDFEIAKGKTSCKAEGDAQVTLRFPVPITSVERLFDGIAIQPASGAKPESGGLGPFLVAERQAGSYLVLARNPRYWKKDENGASLPYLDSIRLEVQRNRDLELMRFRKGEFQIVNSIEPELFDRLKAEMPGAVRDLGASLDAEEVWFNQFPGAPLPANKKDWFKDREFRAAVSLAIHRDDLIRVVYRGHGSPAIAPVSPANQMWWNRALRPPSPDPAGALNRLRGAGFQPRDGKLLDKTGQPVEFSIVTNAGNKLRERMAAMIQQDLKAIGIRVTVVTMDFPSLIERITKTFNYEACLLGTIHSDLDPASEAAVWMSSGAAHQWNPNQKTPATDWEAGIDKWFTAQSSTTDMARRKEAFDQVQRIVVDQAAFIYLVYRNTLVASSTRLGNFEPVAVWPQTLWNAERIYIHP